MRETAREARLRLLPPIRRARLWRLYAEGGRRYLDLWQDGGRGVLGAKARGLGTGLKAAVDMGLDRPLPSAWEGRLEKAALRRWPAYGALRLYRSEASALAALARAAGRPEAEAGAELLDSALLLDPARRPEEGPREPAALLLRPFADSLGPLPSLPLALPLLPCPRAFSPAILLFAEPALAELAGPSELLPPLAARAALASLLELARLEAALGEAHWRRAERRLGGLFRRRGPYLLPACPPEAYEGLFREALGKGLLLSPDHALPSILPGDFDDGELAPLSSP